MLAKPTELNVIDLNRGGVCQGEDAKIDRAQTEIWQKMKWRIAQFILICIFLFYFLIVFPLLCGWGAVFFFCISFLLIHWHDDGILYSHTAALTEWWFVQKRVNIFICLIALWEKAFNSGEEKAGRTVWESFTHPSSAHTPQPLIAATAPNLCNWTWDIRMGGTDARCILKIVLSHWTLS